MMKRYTTKLKINGPEYQKKNQKIIPSYLEAYDIYSEIVKIEKDKLTNLIDISVEHISPVFAMEFLDLIITEANELLRKKDLEESSEAINFLVSEIPKSSLVTMKDAINQLVLVKLETQMMAKISTEYILKEIEPPFVPEQKSWPKRSQIVISVTLVIGLFSCLLVLIYNYLIVRKRANY